MSFMNIKDPEERDAKIADYADNLAMVKRLQKRNLAERNVRQRDLEETYEPIVASNEKMVQEVIEDLIPIEEELK